MAKCKQQTLDMWLRQAATAMLSLADDIDRDLYSEEPQSESYDLECLCDEALSYVQNYRTECEAREAAMGDDDTVELRHLQHELV